MVLGLRDLPRCVPVRISSEITYSVGHVEKLVRIEASGGAGNWGIEEIGDEDIETSLEF